MFAFVLCPRATLTLLTTLYLLAAPVSGKIYITSPVSGDTWTAGQNHTISWQDDGSEPSMQKFGKASVGVYVGSTDVQTLVQEIVPSASVSTTASIVFTPNPAAGANGNYYFIRFQSLDLRDANNTAYPAEAFSATFTMIGMTGTFNASVQAQLSIGSPAPTSGLSTADALDATPLRSTTPSHSLEATPSPSTASQTANSAARPAMNANSAVIVGFVVFVIMTRII